MAPREDGEAALGAAGGGGPQESVRDGGGHGEQGGVGGADLFCRWENGVSLGGVGCG